MDDPALRPRDWLVVACVLLACTVAYLGAAHAPMPWSPLGSGVPDASRTPMQADGLAEDSPFR